MTSRTHDMVAFASLATVAAFFPPNTLNVPTTFAALVGNIVGALSPDLDQASNRLWDMLPMGNFIGKLARPIFLGHRTISHSLLGIFVYYKLLTFALPFILNPKIVDINIVVVASLVGFVSHLIADSVTREGIPLLFPLPIKFGFPPISSLRIITGSWVEKFVVFPGALVYLAWLVSEYRDKFTHLVKLIQS